LEEELGQMEEETKRTVVKAARQEERDRVFDGRLGGLAAELGVLKQWKGGLIEEGFRQMKEAGEAQGAKVAELEAKVRQMGEAKVRQMGEATGGTVGEYGEW
jgi:hypothetical protein